MECCCPCPYSSVRQRSILRSCGPCVPRSGCVPEPPFPEQRENRVRGHQKSADGSPHVEPPSPGRSTVLLWCCSELGVKLGVKWLKEQPSPPRTYVWSGLGGKPGCTGPAPGDAGPVPPQAPERQGQHFRVTRNEHSYTACMFTLMP